MSPFRVGFGYDVHQLAIGSPLWLGGIEIPSEKGAVGHSDADVLLHAISDALLGSLSLGDIGVHFPNTDASIKGIDSKLILKKAGELVREQGYEVGNIDVSLCLEKPKIVPHIPAMKKAIAFVLQLEEHQISIKATTKEKLGFVGREEGIEASAVVLVYRKYA